MTEEMLARLRKNVCCHIGKLEVAIKRGKLLEAETMVRKGLGIADPAIPVHLWVRFAAGEDVPAPAIIDNPGKPTYRPNGNWSDSSWLNWFRNRMERGGFLMTEGGKVTVSSWRTATMHVMFMYLEETEEMLYRLRHCDDPPIVPSEAGSKIFTTPLVPSPIDSTAASVSGMHPRKGSL